jgi:hypothetical protein
MIGFTCNTDRIFRKSFDSRASGMPIQRDDSIVNVKTQRTIYRPQVGQQFFILHQVEGHKLPILTMLDQFSES